MSGRLVALADVFDALTHERPYKHAWPLAEATAEIHRLRSRQFDPDVVDVFRQLDARALLGPLEDRTESTWPPIGSAGWTVAL